MSIYTFVIGEKFHHHFQPIYDIRSEEKIGFEVLLRSTKFPNPEMAFREARKEEQLYELDSRSIRKAVHSYLKENLGEREEYLFINIFPSTILHENFPNYLKTIMPNKSKFGNENTFTKVVLEITESEEITVWEFFKERLLWLKQQGFLLAIDDIGRGYNNLQLYIDLDIDFLKLDRYLAKDLHLLKKKQTFIQLYLNLCQQYGAKLILEGIENDQEMAMAKKLKVPYAQGYYLGKPALLQQYCKLGW